MIVCVSIILERADVPRGCRMKNLNGSSVFRSRFCHCKVGHFIAGKLIGVLSSLLACSSCMGSEARRERTTRASNRQSRVGRIS